MKLKITLTVITISIILFLLLFPPLRSSHLHPFQIQSQQQRTMESIKNVRISEFRSSRYRYKSLFPYDFIYGNPPWNILIYTNPKYLTEEDRLNLEFYNECMEIGIDLEKIDYFFLIEIEATAGFDMDNYLQNIEIEFNTEESYIKLPTPQTKLNDLVILDHLKDSDFPDVEITPEKWKDLMELLTPKLEEMVIDHGILELSDETNKSFIEELFLSLGWNSVFFR